MRNPKQNHATLLNQDTTMKHSTLKSTSLITFAIASLMSANALASDIMSQHKLSWSENCGWMNWRDAGNPASSQGVLLQNTFLSGYIWSENVGWINLGDGTPVNGVSYANATGADFGVNLDPVSGTLSGLAWGENVGWINFSGGAFAAPAKPARFDAFASRFRGMAWGENIGWINLDDATHFIGVGCPSDLDNGSMNGVPDGAVDVNDLLYFLYHFEIGTQPADLDNGSNAGIPDGGVDINDLLFFLARFESGC